MATEAQPQSLPGLDAARARRRVFLIVLAAFLVMIAAAATATIYATQNYWQSALRAEITRNLTQKAQLFAARVNIDRKTKIADITSQAGQQAGARATVVDASGTVIADSQIPVASLEKEGAQPEFAAALRGDTGVSTRKSGAFGMPVMYVAVPVSGGAVRLAYSLADVDVATSTARRMLVLGCVVAGLAAVVISALTARVISK
jgi:two-component system phosphate regulon sensor histidine kinase PhoR